MAGKKKVENVASEVNKTVEYKLELLKAQLGAKICRLAALKVWIFY